MELVSKYVDTCPSGAKRTRIDQYSAYYVIASNSAYEVDQIIAIVNEKERDRMIQEFEQHGYVTIDKPWMGMVERMFPAHLSFAKISDDYFMSEPKGETRKYSYELLHDVTGRDALKDKKSLNEAIVKLEEKENGACKVLHI